MSTTSYLSRGIDYLGDIGAKLRDLQGYRTLAHEMIQNADDAREATSMTFDIESDALVIDNDGIFSDCQQIEKPECPWKTDSNRGHRCDFHRFRHIASGDKRGEAGTTGAFGIGFISVYQVTDEPELISAGRHWILHENRPENERIEVCPGCSRCTKENLPGTRFILPWARDSQSDLRKALQAEAVPADGPEKIVRDLERSLPIAMLFLKRLRSIEIRAFTQVVCKLQRTDEKDCVILSIGEPKDDRIWHIIRGDFSDAAEQLRKRHPGRIESKRSSKIALAIPATSFDTGLLCACLPTEEDVGLPFHVNADFYPTNDRKHVIFADDFQSEWNREAMRAAARAVGAAVERLPALLDAPRLWSLISTVKEVAEASGKGRRDPILASFWKAVEPQLRKAPIVYTSKGMWTAALDACLLLQKEEGVVIPLLEDLGIHVVHEDLRPFQSLLRTEAIGIPIFNIQRLCTALISNGLDQRHELSALPTCLVSASRRKMLWDEINLLLERHRQNHKAKGEDERSLREVAIAPATDGALWPCGKAYSASGDTVLLFGPLGLAIPFVSNEESFGQLIDLCPKFDAAAAIDALRRAGGDRLRQLWAEKRLPLKQLFEWFENRRQQILSDPSAKMPIAALTIFPSSGHLRPLDMLALPGNFDDPLGLAELVDLSELGGRREFLRDLGMPELDFQTYVVARLPAAMGSSATTIEQRRAAVQLLASRLGEVKDNSAAREVLALTPLVECRDGEFRKANECYFDASDIRECLGPTAHVAAIPANHGAAIRDLWSWMGTKDKPRLPDLISVILRHSDHSYTPQIAQQLQKILAHLGERFALGDIPVELNVLRTTQWLPSRGNSDRWYLPNELYATYQAYLFESQANFIDVPPSVQSASGPLFGFLGVHLAPTPDLVVRHLIHCAANQKPVNTEVYRFLNDKAVDSALNQLLGKKCLWLRDAYCASNQVFWGEHPFGRYRWRLGEDLRSYSNLLKRLNVRDTPNHQDAFEVLSEISSNFATTNAPLDDTAYAVLMTCWQMLEEAFSDGEISADEFQPLRTIKCVPNAARLLNFPEWMFFENRAGLPEKFGEFLKQNVILRPLGAAVALTVAGVRPLGAAVECELLECENPVDCPEMTLRFETRRNQIGRVLASQGPDLNTTDALSRLDHMRCESSNGLVIRYRLSVFGRTLKSDPEPTHTYYRNEDNVFLFSLREGKTPWAAIARELAAAIVPAEDPGRFAAGLKEVLAADTGADAILLLDELGFARLDTVDAAPIEIGEAGETLGTGSPVDQGAFPDGGAPTGPEQLTPAEALKRLLGPGTPPPTPAIPDPSVQTTDASASNGNGRKGSKSRRKGRPVLRTYLPAPDSDGAQDAAIDPDAEEEPSRSPVDEAGVRHVLDYEIDCRRVPKEMPHKNPGYDIESRDGVGKVVRYIEVKSFSGPWKNTYAVLSRRQFDRGMELGDAYWLYVVEFAEREEFEIHRIQNPALKANHFMFDDGWEAMTEPVQPTQEGK